MSKIILIAGLPGSGKTTLLDKLSREATYYCYLDWGRFEITPEGDILGTFDQDFRFQELLTRIKNSENIIIDSSNFCNHKFLCNAEYHLNVNFPNLEIEKYYFENNLKDAKANIFYRDYKDGGKWWWSKEENIWLYAGDHYPVEGPDLGKRSYEVIIRNAERLSKQYIIPNRYTPLKIQVQDEKFYQGWKALIQE